MPLALNHGLTSTIITNSDIRTRTPNQTINVVNIYNSSNKTNQPKQFINSAIKIQKNYRKYRENKKNSTLNDYGFKELNNYKSRITYYYNCENEFIVRSPDINKIRLNAPLLYGTYKSVVFDDGKYIKFLVYEKNSHINRKLFNKLMNTTFKNYESICKALYVDYHSIVAKYGGISLSNLIDKNKYIEITAFKLLLKELKCFHKNKYYFYDIKPSNLMFDGKIVRHTDLDNLANQDNPVMTEKYTIPYFFDNRQDKNLRYLVGKNTDSYAILLSMINATNESGITTTWIRKHIYVKYYQDIKTLLDDPTKANHFLDLYDMINWKLL